MKKILENIICFFGLLLLRYYFFVKRNMKKMHEEIHKKEKIIEELENKLKELCE